MVSTDGSGTGGHFHAVRFYDNEASLCRIVARFIREGLAFGEPGLIIATPEHAQGILAELRARETDVKALQQSDELVVLDAHDTMKAFMVDGVPDRNKFNEVATAAL